MRSFLTSLPRFAVLLIAAVICNSIVVTAQQIAFPGAEGAGRFVTGGRGTASLATTVFEVTNLSDDGNVGSLRYAVTNNSPVALYRTVVFKISGTIHLTSALSFNRANTTIAGQTAPGDGICLADYPVSIGTDNVIVRYMRFRMGDKNQNKGMVNGSGNDDSFDGLGHKNIIVDHCTMSWSDDEAFTFYRGDSTTLQWNLISEPLNYSYHFETGDADFEHHGYGGIWGGRHATFHHNLLVHVQGRMPRFDGSRNLPSSSAPVIGSENADFRNNVLYDWGSYNVNGGEGGNYNIINNYYKYGPSTSSNTSSGVTVKYEVLNPYKQTSPALPYGKYFVNGNYVDGSQTNTDDNWKGAAMNGGTLADTSLAKVDVPFDFGQLATQTATDAYDSVLLDAGCTKPARDTLDQRIINDVRNRTGKIIDVQGGFPHGTAYDQTVNAWPYLNSTTPPVDTDHDGMPDTWETANGSNPNDASDRNMIDANGFTKLENYLNSLTTASSLPLKLLSFNGVKTGSDVKITWITTNETGVSNYAVERSSDQTNYKTIGIVKATNSVTTNQYHYADILTGSGTFYYRLKMNDVDGNMSYSNVISFENKAVQNISISPNPVTGSFTVYHFKAMAGAEIQILTVDGKLRFKQKVNVDALQTNITGEQLAKGFYLLVFINDGSKSIFKFLKE